MRYAPTRVLGGVLFALAVIGLLDPTPAPTRAAPATQGTATRLRLIVETAASFAEVTLDPGVVLNNRTRVTSGAGDARVDPVSRSFRLQNAHPGTTVEAEFLLVVSGLDGNGPTRWRVHLPAGGRATTEIYNANRPGLPRLVDRVESQETDAVVVSPSAGLLDGASAPAAGAPPVVLAAYYPWYIHQTWDSTKFLDHPLLRYSVEQLDEILPVFREAISAGIDAFAVSWQGRDHRVSVAFEAAAMTGMGMAVLMETLAATANHQTTDVDPDTVVDWIEQIVDVYGSRPTYLRLDDRPVIFVYAVGSLKPAQWTDVIGRVRASGRNPVLIADSSNPDYLNAFDGEFNYSTIGVPVSQLDDFCRRTTLATRTFNRMYGGPTRIAVATVSPGYDDTRLHDRPVHMMVDRAGGDVYERQWHAALASQPDWVFITSWNERYENTEIEPGVLYGDTYLRATQRWTTQFGCSPPDEARGSGIISPGRRRCG